MPKKPTIGYTTVNGDGWACFFGRWVGIHKCKEQGWLIVFLTPLECFETPASQIREHAGENTPAHVEIICGNKVIKELGDTQYVATTVKVTEDAADALYHLIGNRHQFVSREQTQPQGD